MGVFSSMRTVSAGAAFTASMRKRLLKPISRSLPSPEMGQRSKAVPMAVLEVMDKEPFSNLQRRGLFSFSLMIREARSMEAWRVRVSAVTFTELAWGMVWR